MKISLERFRELLSFYFDGEESAEEFALIVACLKSSPVFAKVFFDEFKIHVATCRMYARNPKRHHMAALVGISIRTIVNSERVRVSKAIMLRKWSYLAAAFGACSLFFAIAVFGFSDSGKKAAPAAEYSAPLVTASVNPDLQPMQDDSFCGIMTIKQTKSN